MIVRNNMRGVAVVGAVIFSLVVSLFTYAFVSDVEERHETKVEFTSDLREVRE